MLLTDKQASEKWCPMHRTPMVGVLGHSEAQAGAGNDMHYTTGMVTCLGSSCAMWRWHDRPTKWEAMMTVAEARDLGGPESEPPLGEVALGDRRRGYCGLAGKTGIE